MACRSMQTLPRLAKSVSSICVSSSLIPPATGVLDAARTVETRDETSEVGVAEPAVDDDRPVCFCGVTFSSTGVRVVLPLASRDPRGVSGRSGLELLGLDWGRGENESECGHVRVVVLCRD